MDMALDGKMGIIEAVEQDVEAQMCTLRSFWRMTPDATSEWMRQSGHRFFYAVDEVEPI